MKKFRHYLIKKLGGFVEQNNIVLQPPKIIQDINDIETIKVSVKVYDLYDPINNNDVYITLYNKLSSYMFDNNIGRVIEEYDAENRTKKFTLILRVGVDNGTKKEHN